MRLTKIIISAVFTLMATVAFSQDLHVFLHNVEEDRFWGEDKNRSRNDTVSRITLITMINGLQLDKDHFIKVKNVRAADDKGKQLKELGDPFWGKRPAEYQAKKKVELAFEAPTRNAARIKVVEGIIQYFTPTEENNAKMVIRDFIHRENENLLADFRVGMELTLIEADSLQTIAKARKKAFHTKIEQLKKENEIADEEAEELDFVIGLLGDIIRFDDAYPSRTLNFYRNDGKEHIYQINVYNGNDEKINTGYTFSEDLYQIKLSEVPAADCRMEVILENENAVKELRFRLENIILP
ncbi:hypothetical protein LS482_15280 [Sinomicrobium kalidii]|uniref:hypothetical protein n=1 Tax=Sinomicrobium kalidii TaxID=2900738 RepID=UPI001E5A2904|nr:hypothetical protein [Sinomicrobium kalidii]UGU15040.1 hypothetical protein LS482_15280 [Sinomicrobium kalidii]